jgi:hypothetical protein
MALLPDRLWRSQDWVEMRHGLSDDSILFFRTKKDLYSIWERDTNPFYEKDPGDYANYKEDHPMSREHHRTSPPLTAALIQVEGTPNVGAGKKTNCQSQRAAPSIGFTTRVDAMRPPCRT